MITSPGTLTLMPNSETNWIAEHVAFLLLLLLVSDLVMDGLLRRLWTGRYAKVFLYFAKDALCLGIWVFSLHVVIQQVQAFAWFAVVIVCLLVINLPSFILTTFHDPRLALFGLKQRFLPLGVALVPFVEARTNPSHLICLEWTMTFFLGVTGLLAVWQTHLPATHWLNTRPGGAPLPPWHIKAGIPRVSSTFSFFAQYGFFIVVAAPIALALLSSAQGTLQRFTVIMAIVAGASGAYAANSRLAVLAPMLIAGFVSIVQLFCCDGNGFCMSGGYMIVLLLTRLLLDRFAPPVTAGYRYRAERAAQRSGGNVRDLLFRVVQHNDHSVLLARKELGFFGGRLGGLSLGTETFSPWAAKVRSRFTVDWGENLLKAALVETGWWGILTEALGRIALLGWLAWTTFGAGRPSGTNVPVLGAVILIGVFAYVHNQFPLACWFWLAVGMLLALSGTTGC